MAHHTKKSHRRGSRSVKKNMPKLTIRNHGMRVIRHHPSVRGKSASRRNIHRALSHMVPQRMNVEEEKQNSSMANARGTRARLSRAAKSAYQQQRNAEAAQQAVERAERELEKAQREQQRHQKAAQAAAMNNVLSKFGAMGI